MRKILWTVDAFGDKTQQIKMADVLKALCAKEATTIEPVMVLSPDQLRVPPSAFKSHNETYRLKADSILNDWVKKIKGLKVTKPTLLVSESFSTRASANVLLDYAKETGASAIAVGTRAKKGLIRVLLGSFAETLLLQSKTPLIVVNPKTVSPKKFQHVLFTTDLSDVSKSAFDDVISLCKAIGAKLVVYHKLEYVIPETVLALHETPVYDQYLDEDIKRRESTLQGWVDKAKTAGIKTTLLFDKRPGFVVDGVLKTAKKLKGCLIAIASHTGPVASTVLGSVARQVIRDTKSPIWVVHK